MREGTNKRVQKFITNLKNAVAKSKDEKKKAESTTVKIEAPKVEEVAPTETPKVEEAAPTETSKVEEAPKIEEVAPTEEPKVEEPTVE